MDKSIYNKKGYSSRKEYLEELAENYGVKLETVLVLADTLGPSEDFDGLISALEDAGSLDT